MTGKQKLYVVAWGILLTVFNGLTFASLFWARLDGYVISFWLRYLLINSIFVGMLYFSVLAFRAEREGRYYRNYSVTGVCSLSLLATFTIGVACILIVPMPFWICFGLCTVPISVAAFTVIKTSILTDVFTAVGGGVAGAAYFAGSLARDIDILVTRAKSSEVREECARVHDAFIAFEQSGEEVSDEFEAKARAKVKEFSRAVYDDDIDSARRIADELEIMLNVKRQSRRYDYTGTYTER